MVGCWSLPLRAANLGACNLFRYARRLLCQNGQRTVIIRLVSPWSLPPWGWPLSWAPAVVMTPPLDKVGDCTVAWSQVLPPQPEVIFSPPAYAAGTLYYATFAPQMLNALPVGGGVPTVVAPTYATEVWSEGDHLLYVAGNLGSQFYTLPIGGGMPTLLFDAAAGRPGAGVSLRHAFTESAFFWTEESAGSDGPTTVWRASRPEGVPTQLGTVVATYPGEEATVAYEQISVGQDAVLLAATLGIAYAVPFDGGPARRLAAPAAQTATLINLAGIDSSGVYWSVPETGAPSADDTRSLAISPVDGGAARYSGSDHLPIPRSGASGPPRPAGGSWSAPSCTTTSSSTQRCGV